MSDANPGPPAWYCPGCGERHFGAGTCANGHDPLTLILDPDVEAPVDAPAPDTGSVGTDPETTGANDGAEAEAPPATEPEPEASPPPEAAQEPQAEAPTEVVDPSPEPAAAEPEPEAAVAESVEPSTLEKAKDHVRQAFDLLAQL